MNDLERRDSLSHICRSSSGFSPVRQSTLSRLTTTQIVVIILLISCVVYFNSLFNGFVSDDSQQVLNNPWIRDAANVKEIFFKSAWGFIGKDATSNYYRPLMHIFFMIDYHIFGFRPWGFHMANILLHSGVSLLVFFVSLRLLKESPSSSSQSSLALSFAAALLFAVHPVHTEAVAWISAIPEISFTLFSLLCLHFYLRSRETLFESHYALSVVSFCMALLSKETAVVVPIMLMAYDYIIINKRICSVVFWKKHFVFFIVTMFYLILRNYSIGGFTPLRPRIQLTTYEYIINIFPLFIQYLTTLIFPISLNAFHVFHPISSVFELRGIVSVLASTAFGVGIFVSLKKNKVVSFCLLLVIIPLLPALYIRGLSFNVFCERYLYFSSFGFILLLSLFMTWTKAKIARGTFFMTVIIITLFVSYSMETVIRNTVWKDNYVLITDSLKKSPDSHLLRIDLAHLLYNQGRVIQAFEQLQLALKLKPDSAEIHKNLGVTYGSMGQLDAAVWQFRTALSLKPDYAEAHYNLGIAFMRKGEKRLALQEFETTLKINPNLIEARQAINSLGYLRK